MRKLFLLKLLCAVGFVTLFAFASSAQTMHLALVRASEDGDDISDQRQLKIFFSDVCEELGITLQEYEMDPEPEFVLSCLNSITPSPDDIIIFCHHGHGSRGPENGCQDTDTDPWPYLGLRGGSLPMRQVKQILESKPARLTCAFSNCCNSYSESCRDDISFRNRRPTYTTTNNYKNLILALGYKQLFLNSTGHICATASIPGFFGYRHDRRVGIYYQGLMTAFSRHKFDSKANWKPVLYEAFTIAHMLRGYNGFVPQCSIVNEDGVEDYFSYSSDDYDRFLNIKYIDNAQELKDYFQGLTEEGVEKSAVLAYDIDMSNVSLEIVRNFPAIFNGNGHTIRNLTISSQSDDDTIGLFGSLSDGAVICNLTLENCSFNGSASVGAICGANNGGTIIDCKVVDCNVTSNNTSGSPCVGGVCGIMEGNSIIEGVEVSNTKVSSPSGGDAGGIVGWVNKGLVLRCHTTSDDEDAICVSGHNAGGIVASENGGNSYIWQCINNVNVHGENCAGGITTNCSNGSRINQCINHGKITGEKISGLSPYVTSLGWMTNSYTTQGKISLDMNEQYVTNCYRLVTSRNDVDEYSRLKSDFESGYVAYRLAEGCENPKSGSKAPGKSWGQHLGKDPYPVFDAEPNDENSSTAEVHFKDNQYHNAEYQENGTCKACDGEMIHDVDEYYLSFHALEDITITFEMNGEDFDPEDYYDPGDNLSVDLQYSVDGTDNWQTYKYLDKINIKKGQNVYFRGDNSEKGISDGEDFYYTFRSTGKFEAHGDIMSLLSYKTKDVSVPGYCFYKMFYNCKGLVTAPTIGAEDLNYNCYESMFENCTSLVYVPDIRAFNLPGESFLRTFKGCTSLQRSPKMYFNVFYSGEDCKEMFADCPNLESIFAFFPEWEDGGFVDWVKNVAPSGTFYCLSELPRKYGDSNIPTNWEIKSCYDYEDGTLSGPDYLCFMGYTYMNIKLKTVWSKGIVENVNLEYSLDKVTWHTMDYNTEISVKNFQPVYFRGINEDGINTQDNILNFSVDSDDFDVSGDIMSLINYKTMPKTIPNDYCFYAMFYGNYNMRRGPKLSATNLSAYCYRELFASTGIVELPELPAKYLDWGSYQLMCENCSSLEYVGDINVISLENSSLDEMFRDCPKLTKAPKITSQYYGKECLGQMFYNSKKLNEIVVDFDSWTNSDGDEFTRDWVSGVASTGDFYCPSSLPEEYGVSRIPQGWKRIPIQSAELFITNLPNKIEYFVNDKINTTGLKLQSINNIGKIEDIDVANCEFEYDFSNVGNSTVKVKYQEQIASFDVVVKKIAISSISITSLPKNEYKCGEDLSLTGGIITVTYNNGDTKQIALTDENVVIDGFDNTQAGTQTLTVSYSGCETSFIVTVSSKNEPSINNPYSKPAVIDNVYQISTAEELLFFMFEVNNGNETANAILLNDIVINADLLKNIAELLKTTSKAAAILKQWEPIGTLEHPYRGTFDGNGHTISGIYIKDETQNYVGLFGNVAPEAVIKNLGVTDSYIAGNENVGAICGKAEGTIVNCYTVSEIKGSKNVNPLVGAKETTAVVENCYYFAEQPVANDPCAKTAEEFKSGDVAKLLAKGATINGVTYSGETFAGVTELPGTDIIPQPGNNDNPSTSISSISENNVKVWSFNNTIYIENAPDTKYTIIDLNGRPIKSATTTSTKEEINLNKSGVFVVVINGNAYKVSL